MMKQTLGLVWVLLANMARLIPHPANVTPSLAVALFAGSKFSRLGAIALVTASLAISDVFLASVHGTAIFGMWSVFTYSGFLIIALVARNLGKNAKTPKLLGFSIGGSLFFWLYTNLGVWLTSAVYAKSFAGLMECYIVALPFLRNALLGDLLFVGVLFASYAWVEKGIVSGRATA